MTVYEALPLVLVMAGVTYLIRMLPITLIRTRLRSPFLQRLLYYIPYAVLSAMTIPAIFTSAGALIPSLAGCALGIILSWKERSLIVVALSTCACAWVVSLLLQFIS